MNELLYHRIIEKTKWLYQRYVRGYVFVRVGSVFITLSSGYSDFDFGDILIITGGRPKNWEINETGGLMWYFDKRRFKRLKY